MDDVKISFPEDNDITWVSQSSNIVTPFQPVKVKKLFETANWSLIVKKNDQPRAYAAFQSYPNMHYDSADWEQQMQSDIGEAMFDGLGTLFLRYFVCELNEGEDLQLILKKTFNSLPFIKYCCFITQSDQVSEILSKYFTQTIDLKDDLHVWSCKRRVIIPEVGIRSKRSEDYLSLKNLFSQIYSLSESKLKNFTLDFLDFGEDRCPTYKYFTFDADNTYIGIADKRGGEAVGFIYATTQHVDLDFLNMNFQLDAVYGLRKKHPDDDPEISFDADSEQQIPQSTTDDTSDVDSEQSILELISSESSEPSSSQEHQSPTSDTTGVDRTQVPQSTTNETSDVDSAQVPQLTTSDTTGRDSAQQVPQSTTSATTGVDNSQVPQPTTSETSDPNSTQKTSQSATSQTSDAICSQKPPQSTTRESSGADNELPADEDVLRCVTELLDEVESKSEIIECLKDIFDEICPNEDYAKETPITDDLQKFLNSEYFDLSNTDHLSLITPNNMKHFTSDTLVNLVNSTSFDAENKKHFELVPHLMTAINQIEDGRLEEILNSDHFDPAEEIFAEVSLLIMEKMPPRKLRQFEKSSIGGRLCENIKLKRAISKKRESIKLSYADKQAILRNAEKSSRLKKMESDDEKSLKPSERDSRSSWKELKFKNVGYRNMGFISGLAVRENYSLPKLKEFLGYSSKEDVYKTKDNTNTEDKIYDSCEKYPTKLLKSKSGLKINIPTYHGDPNYTLIEQLAIEKEYESGSLFLIMAAFEYFSRVDYGIILLPYGTKQVPLLRQYFTRIPALPFSTFEKELYVFHRGGFNQTFRIRRYEKSDLQGVQKLIKCSCLKDYLLSDLEQCLADTDKKNGVILLSGDQIFGIAIVSEILELEFIKKHFDIADRVNIRHHKHKFSGELLHCVLHPVAKYMAAGFLNEAMRLSEISILYYKIHPSHIVHNNPSYWKSLCNVLEELIPLRLKQKYPPKLSIMLGKGKIDKMSSKLQGNTLTTQESTSNSKESMLKTQNNTFSVCYTCTKWVLRDKSVVSSRIVVIGCSDIALGILESLIYNFKYRFTNLTIITKNGMPGELQLNEKCYNFISQKSDYNQQSLDSLCLPAWVTTIKGRLTSIEHNFLQMKDVKEDNPKSFQIGFDFLVICEELEFQTERVERSKTPKENVCRRYSMLKHLWDYTYDTVGSPRNVFSLNTADDGATILNWLWNYFSRETEVKDQTVASEKQEKIDDTQTNKKVNRIIVHGNCLNAYTCIAVLLKENFSEVRLTFVKFCPTTKSSSYYTSDIEEAVIHVLRQSDLEIYEGNLDYNDKDDEITYVGITTADDTFRLDCCALISFNTKNINYNTFKVLHHSSLAFTLPITRGNGYPYLLINTSFQTNVRNIFAAGTITEMHTQESLGIRFENCSYNQREIGSIVGENISRATDETTQTSDIALPNFHRPSVAVAKLPFELTYILIMKPSSEFIKNCEPNIDKNSVLPLRLVLGNMKTGVGIVPEAIPESETGEEGESNEASEKVSQDKNRKDSAEKTEVQQSMSKVTTEQLQETPATVANERTYPDEPEYFAIEFNVLERVQRIECLTKRNVVVESLIHLYDLPLKQLYKIIQIVRREDSDKVSFCLAEDWVLPVDYFTLQQTELAGGGSGGGCKAEDDSAAKCGFEGYWRPGYPDNMQSRITAFLDNFSKHTSK